MSFLAGYQKLRSHSVYADAADSAKSLAKEFDCDILLQVGDGGWEVWVPKPVYKDIQEDVYERDLDRGY